MPVVTRSSRVESRRQHLTAAVVYFEDFLTRVDRFTYIMGSLSNEVLSEVALLLSFIVLAVSRDLRHTGPWAEDEAEDLREILRADDHWERYGRRYPVTCRRVVSGFMNRDTLNVIGRLVIICRGLLHGLDSVEAKDVLVHLGFLVVTRSRVFCYRLVRDAVVRFPWHDPSVPVQAVLEPAVGPVLPVVAVPVAEVEPHLVPLVAALPVPAPVVPLAAAVVVRAEPGAVRDESTSSEEGEGASDGESCPEFDEDGHMIEPPEVVDMRERENRCPEFDLDGNVLDADY